MAPAAVATRTTAMTTLAPEGVVTAIVGVTGVVDLVEDLIVPRAFTRTLATRRPKVSIGHSWTDFVGRILSIDELLPGDARLPKHTKDGKPWPAEAGALIATMQFNLNVQAGRDAYEWVRFYSQNDECEFSIGYKVVPSKVAKRRDGVRVIYDLDVFEISLVLFGAAPQTMVLEIKGIDGFERVELEYKTAALIASLDGDAAAALIEAKALPMLEGKTAEPMAGRGVMVALYPDVHTASTLAVPDGNAPDDLHVTLAYLGDAAELGTDPAELADTLRGAVADPSWQAANGASSMIDGKLSGHVGGIGQFPDGGDGHPSYVPVDVPGLENLQHHIMKKLHEAGHGPRVSHSHGFIPHMTLGYDLPPQPPVPPTPVSFDKAHLVVGDDKYALPFTAATPKLQGKDIEGTARFAVFEATDGVGLEGKSGNAGNAASLIKWYDAGAEGTIGWGTDGDYARCVTVASAHMTETQAKGFCNLRHKEATGIYPATHAKLVREAKSAPGSPTAPDLETKTMDADVPGSFEQRQDLLRDAIRSLMCPPPEDHGDGGLACERGWACIEATYPDYVIATVRKDDVEQSYAFPYTFDGDGVSVGEPEPVKLSVQVVPDADAAGDGEDGVLVDDDAAVNVRFISPASSLIDRVATLVAMTPPSASGKSLRDELREPLRGLVEQLEAKAAKPAAEAGADDVPGEDDDPWAGLLDDADAGSDESDTTGAVKTAADGEPAATDGEPALADAPTEGAAAADAPADGEAATADDKPAVEGKDAAADLEPTFITLDPEQVRAELATFGVELEGKTADGEEPDAAAAAA